MRVSTSELLVIFVVALLVLGPEKMPKYAKKAGKLLSSVKVYADKLTEDINESVVEPLEEVQKPLKEAVEPLTTITKDIKKSVDDIGKPKKKESIPAESEDSEEKQEKAVETVEIHETEETQESIDSQETKTEIKQES